MWDAGLRKRGMETEQTKSTKNHYVELFPQNMNQRLNLPPDDIRRKDSTVRSSQGQRSQLAGIPPSLQGTFGNTGRKGAPGIWRVEARDADKHRTMHRTTPLQQIII